MIFYYDPILGLQYSTMQFFAIKIDVLPKTTTTLKECLELINKQGIILKDSNEQTSVEPINIIHTN
jgi:thioredoxin reductase